MDLLRAKRVAGTAVFLIIGLGITKGVVGVVSGSVALQADAVHTLADLIAISASWFGLTLATRGATDRFPYGYYRAESIAALVASSVIVVMGGGLLCESAIRVVKGVELERPVVTLAMASISAVAAYFISSWERSAADVSNSQSLSATAAETRMDAFSSLLVFCSGLGALIGVFWLDGLIGGVIALIILWIGLKNIKQALLSLMDASVDPELEAEIAEVVGGVDGIKNVEKILLRRAGPFYFLDGHIWTAPSLEVERGHEIAHAAGILVREKFPTVEGVMFHVEPYRSDKPTVAVPIETDDGLDAPVCKHFGRAPYFLVGKVGGHFEVIENDMQDRDVRAGLEAIRKLLRDTGFEEVIVRQIGEIAFFTLRDKFVEVFQAGDESAGEALEKLQQGRLKILKEPTHSSERKLNE
jgi:cation diffusion facilitator family transporter